LTASEKSNIVRPENRKGEVERMVTEPGKITDSIAITKKKTIVRQRGGLTADGENRLECPAVRKRKSTQNETSQLKGEQRNLVGKFYKKAHEAKNPVRSTNAKVT